MASALVADLPCSGVVEMYFFGPSVIANAFAAPLEDAWDRRCHDAPGTRGGLPSLVRVRADWSSIPRFRSHFARSVVFFADVLDEAPMPVARYGLALPASAGEMAMAVFERGGGVVLSEPRAWPMVYAVARTRDELLVALRAWLEGPPEPNEGPFSWGLLKPSPGSPSSPRRP
jgi:hypothetical protein